MARRLALLDIDPFLLTGADEAARRHLTAPVLRVRRGAWPVSPIVRAHTDGWLGLLVLDGLLIRTLSLGDLECCELLGPGDVIRPWQADDAAASLAGDATWRAVEDSRVAILDESFTRLACRWPAVMSELMERAIRRSRSLTVQLAIAQVRNADVRLLALFWHLADRWGRVTQDGVLIELELTHSLLSRLTCLRRPTVSLTLKQLESEGELMRLTRSRWLLRGTNPSERHRAIGLPVAA